MVVDEVVDLGVSRQLGKHLLRGDGGRKEPALELLEQGGGGELKLRAHGEPVRQEHVEAASCNSAGRLFRAPAAGLQAPLSFGLVAALALLISFPLADRIRRLPGFRRVL
ncbi:hypothetical protein [Streptomyces sp. CNZ287]|uniref:hypothetical protein n=1 Tax=Streptomyces sp. B22F1 TaxID=3153566 RepID=UPI0016468667